ncbi:Metallo-dependent phosphatase-like protein [Spinellus fusiger]|nr:Metallo-dependent phosphatase-like protein [Spinellus fusiger]
MCLVGEECKRTDTDTDLAVHAGDLTRYSRLEEFEKTFQWIGALPHSLKVITAGNHDGALDSSLDYGGQKKKILSAAKKAGILYLEHEAYLLPPRLGSHKLFVSPMSPTHLAGAFMQDNLQAEWEAIPLDTNILVTHTPPLGYQDVIRGGRHVGCPYLREKIDVIKPHVSIFGHIHEGYGYCFSDNTLFINAATNSIRYRPVQPPIVFDL